MAARVDDRPVRRALRNLAQLGGPKAIAGAINRTLFEVREESGKQVARALSFKGSSTKNFLASEKSFLVRQAKPSRLEGSVFAKDKAANVLAIHESGGRVTDDSGRTLRLGSKIAIPVGVRVNARGRVAKGQTPAALLASGKAFISKSGKAIVRRKGKKQTEVAYALTESFKDRPRLGFLGNAERTIRKVFAEKARREIEKAVERARQS